MFRLYRDVVDRTVHPADILWRFRFFRFVGAWILFLASHILPPLPPGLALGKLNLEESSERRRLTKFGLTAGLIDLFLAFGGTALFAWFCQKLSGESPDVRYFFKGDPWNFALYLFVCPLYVGLGAMIIRNTISQWPILEEFAGTTGSATGRRHYGRRAGIFWISVFLLALSLTLLYINGVLTLGEASRRWDGSFIAVGQYWFMEIGNEGQRSLNLAGGFYTLLIFLHLLCTMIAVMCYLSMGYEVLKIGRRSLTLSHADTAEYRRRIIGFTYSYFHAKLLACVYIVNVVIWGWSPLGGAEASRLITNWALWIIVILLISFPMHYLQFNWRLVVDREYRSKVAETQNRIGNLKFDVDNGSLLTSEQRLLAELQIERKRSELEKERAEAERKRNEEIDLLPNKLKVIDKVLLGSVISSVVFPLSEHLSTMQANIIKAMGL